MGSKGRPNKDGEGRRLESKLHSGIFIRKVGHIFLHFTFLLGFAATFIMESGVGFVYRL